ALIERPHPAGARLGAKSPESAGGPGEHPALTGPQRGDPDVSAEALCARFHKRFRGCWITSTAGCPSPRPNSLPTASTRTAGGTCSCRTSRAPSWPVGLFVSHGDPRLLGRILAAYGRSFDPRELLAYTLL